MPILSGDVKLLKSAVMADVPEGGGAPTGSVIADGVSNAIFPDISELDRAGGRVNLRKTFVSVQTDDTDTYFGGNIIVADPPEDPRVSVTLFATNATFDVRTQAASRVESYLNKGPEWGGYLHENHIAGQRVIQLFQRPNAEVPPVGRTLVLVQNEGLGTQKEQYVRITSVSGVASTFTYSNGGNPVDFQATLVTCDISDALRYDFTGSPASRFFTRLATSSTLTRDTVVADAGTYVGVVPLSQASMLGDFGVKATSIYTQLVPSAQTETPISFALPYNGSGLPVEGPVPVTYTLAIAWTPTTNINLPGGCLPGSLTITTAGITITDVAGVLATGTGDIGFIDYSNGLLTLTSTTLSGAKVITYTPAARVLRAPQSSEYQITQETRSLSYVGVITPIPQPGTFSISYLAQGRWYVLSEQGDGVLRGLDSSFGIGTFNPDTGAFLVTLGALPDAPSSLIFVWNTPTQETTAPVTTLKASQTIELNPPANTGVQVGSLTVSWDDGVARTASAQNNGTLSGFATGTLRAADGILEFAPNNLPAVGALLTIDYFSGPKQSDNFPYPSRDGGGLVPVTASLGAITPGSLEVSWNTFTDEAALQLYTTQQIREMGINLQLVDPIQTANDDALGNLKRFGVTIGTVDYATGLVTFQPDVAIKVPRPVYATPPITWNQLASGARVRISYTGMEYVSVPSLYPNDASGYVILKYNAAGATNAQQEIVTFDPSFRLVPDTNASVIPGSVVLFNNASQPWGDSALGVLREYTSAGYVQRGLIDYLTGKVQLTSWTTGGANSITRSSCVTTVGENISSGYTFRTASAPLRPGSLTITFARSTGGTQNVTADTAGAIVGTGVQGTVDFENGVVRLQFGTNVTAVGNEAEPWYAAGFVDPVTGLIFKPQPIAASTLRYSAVAFSYLPLNADLLGIDPVRLPSDGRVPIFRPGGFAVVGHTGEITSTVANGQTVDCGRVRLSRVRVIGADGGVINTGYTADLELGTVTFTNVTGYLQPVTIQNRIEDMGVVREASISGNVIFTRPLTHNYPLPGSFVSSALIAGDLFARTSLVFDQASWNGAFADAVVGSAATATFNAAQYPFAVTNRGAITERWIVRFTNTTAFEVIGENVGVIATGATGANCEPINPATGVPYFSIPALGWGIGWATGNVVRFNTIGAQFPVWVVRTVQQGPMTVPDDAFTLLIRGDVDTP